MTKPLSRGMIWFLSLLTAASVASTQALFDASARPYEKDLRRAILSLNIPLLPSVPALRVLSMGNPSAMADLLWLQTIQYFGTGSPYGKYPALGPMLDTITQLDPKFSYAYEFGLVVLPFMDNADAAVKLGERAQQELPGNGLLTYYLATVYHLNFKDYEKAHYYYDKASREEGAPGSARVLAGITLSNNRSSINDRKVALEFWKTVYDNAKDDSEKARAETWYHHVELLYKLEMAAELYKEQRGSFPPSLQDLKNAGYIPDLPLTSLDRPLEINPETGAVNFANATPPTAPQPAP